MFVHGFESDFFSMLDADSGVVLCKCEIVSTRCWFHYAVERNENVGNMCAER